MALNDSYLEENLGPKPLLDPTRPSRWIERLLYDHPSYASRLAYASSISAHKSDQGEQNW